MVESLSVVLKKQSVDEGTKSTARDWDQWVEGGRVKGVSSADICREGVVRGSVYCLGTGIMKLRLGLHCSLKRKHKK